jgi:hypothetical protein
MTDASVDRTAEILDYHEATKHSPESISHVSGRVAFIGRHGAARTTTLPASGTDDVHGPSGHDQSRRSGTRSGLVEIEHHASAYRRGVRSDLHEISRPWKTRRPHHRRPPHGTLDDDV